MVGGCIIAEQDGHKIKMAPTANISVPTKIHNYKEEGETGVTLRITAYIVYSKSAGDNRDLEQAVILTSDYPWEVLIIGVGLY